MDMTDEVLVLGGGLAGVACAKELASAGVSVALVDRNDYHQFQPLLYQVASSQLPAEDIARPHRTIFREHPHVRVVTSRVVEVDLTQRSLLLADGTTLVGTHLVVAAGAQPNFFGVPGAEEHAFPLYSVPDAERLRLHLRDLLREAIADPAAISRGSIDVVVVGGGPTGVETAGAVAELMQQLKRSELLEESGRITLVDRGDALLGQFSDKAHRYSLRRLTEAGVDVRLGVGVTAVRADGIELDETTTIPARTVVWGGGESGAVVIQEAGPKPGRGGRIDVEPDLTVDGFPGTYVIGDAANIPSADPAVPLPQLGSVAQQSGRWAARNILHEQRGEPTEPFAYKDKGIMAMIGRNAAVAEVGKHRHQVEGPIAFAAWLGVHAMLLSGVHSKTDAFLNWAWEYFDHDHTAHIEASAAPHRIAWETDEDDVPHIHVADRQSADAAPPTT
jgi:NADH dehydrogenase